VSGVHVVRYRFEFSAGCCHTSLVWILRWLVGEEAGGVVSSVRGELVWIAGIG
jgi:hypothetical protein